MSLDISEKLITKILFLGVILVTVLMVNGGVTDPVNAPKLTAIGAVSFAAFANLTAGNWKYLTANFIIPCISVFLFTLLGFMTVLASPAPLTQNLYGVYGRNNGYLLYVFLVMIFCAALSIKNRLNFEKLLNGLLISGLINLIYCGWVLIFGDFMSWSNPYGNILGTFGNPNFIGSFLGIFFGVWLARLFSDRATLSFKIASLFVLPLTAVEIYFSRAIQGRVLLAVGFSVVIFFIVRAKTSGNWATLVYLGFTVVIGILALLGVLQRGPLSAILYKESVSLRGQYWLSGWNTGIANPIFGSGFDSLGDWYRRSREAKALLKPGIDVVVNASHNVPLDILAFGGFPLAIAYLCLILYTIYKVIKFTFLNRNYNFVFVALTVSWVGYQLQSIISINQIGLAIWGWLLTGLLLAYCHVASNEIHIPEKKRISRKLKKSTFAYFGINTWVGMIIGGLVAIPPLTADMKWMQAQNSRNVILVEESLTPSYFNPQNSFKYTETVLLLERSQLFDIAHKYARKSVEFNPDNYNSWKVLYLLKQTSEKEKSEALKNLQRLDPLNPDVTK